MRARHAPRILAAAAALLLVGVAAQAHQPSMAEQDMTVDDPTISAAIYGEFEHGDEVFTVHLDYEFGFALPFELLIPHKSSQRDHRPMYAVIGPGLPPATAEELDLLPADVQVPSGAGVYLERHDDPDREVIFEGYTRRIFWSSGPVALPLQPGETVVVLWSPEQTTGEFVLGLGVEEDFSEGFGDVFRNWGAYAY
jgi:hypothetical protein